MSKVYKCDSCGRMIDDPYEERVREFYIGLDYHSISDPSVREFNMHLCKRCYRGLSEIKIRLSKEMEVKEDKGTAQKRKGKLNWITKRFQRL